VSELRVRPLGDAAVSVELGESLDPVTNARVRALDHDLARAPFDGFREAVPTHRSLLVLYEPGAIRHAGVEREVRARAARLTAALPTGRLHEMAAVYGGTDGPDLAPLAHEKGLAEGELVRASPTSGSCPSPSRRHASRRRGSACPPARSASPAG
jgi:inhibitor of KinA